MIWKQVAFAGRYGGQGVAALLDMTRRDIDLLCNSIGGLIEQESDSLHEYVARGR